MARLIIISIVTCFIVFNLMNSYSINLFTPEQLANVPLNSNKINLVDTKGYLKSTEKIEELSKLVLEIQQNYNLEVFIYFISEISKNYGYYIKGKNIELFTNDLSYIVLKADQNRDRNSIFIVYSIEDRQSRIRTGENARNYIQDGKLTTYQEKIKTHMRNGDYDEALLKLIKQIHNRIFTKYQFLSDLWDFVYSILIILMCVFIGYVIYNIMMFFKEKISPAAEEKLRKIKEISENGKPRKEIIESTCVICLDYLQQEENNNNNNNNNDELPNLDEINAEPARVAEIELNDRNDRNSINNLNISDEEKKLIIEKEKENSEKKKVDFIATLECGHKFHSKCIAGWMTKQNKCPVCREHIDKEETTGTSGKENTSQSTSTSSIGQSLINIQNNIHPELSLLDFTYSNNSVSWRYRPRETSGESSGSSYSSSWGSGSGGSSSSW